MFYGCIFFLSLFLVFIFVIMVLLFCVMVGKFEMFWFRFLSIGKVVVLNRCVVIFDVGSLGSWVYIYCFDWKNELVKVGDELEIFMYIELGLSDFVKNF